MDNNESTSKMIEAHLKMAENLSLKEVYEIHKSFIHKDVMMTRIHYKEGGGTGQIDLSKYHPGFFGRIFLEKGQKGLEEMGGLNEKGIRELFKIEIEMEIRIRKVLADIKKEMKDNFTEIKRPRLNLEEIRKASFKVTG